MEQTIKWETIKKYYQIYYCPECGEKTTFCNIYAGIYECPNHGVILVYYHSLAGSKTDE